MCGREDRNDGRHSDRTDTEVDEDVDKSDEKVDAEEDEEDARKGELADLGRRDRRESWRSIVTRLGCQNVTCNTP